ncbi:hypothetical protein H1R82_13230 [Thermoactinomyces intermedius]|jgi:hypothetical protein|uniref:Immunity protein Imm6 n=1 Tax=Thermoactinomyces intermedius TaxID=2024 RepID=A0A8I1A675_THEIN|nr:Imm6 family immunity protein [Thermoactinomyces intermedius]MBA4549428.1 hypothetical protein [Thermoactinomyces intermedius]MBA4837591.1 hypothetical protein [Thermoactinomyces intermedius]MBH8596477.1 hypothetical protein [Thermoactinomyces intermedius]
MSWFLKIHEDAKSAYLLALTEKLIDKIRGKEGFQQVRKTIDMCWEWVEEKKHEGDDIYFEFDNENDTGVSIYIELTDDPQEELIWMCAMYAICYVAWQAYNYANEKYVPQPIEMVDDDTIDEFMKYINKIEGYQEEWSERLKEYLLKNYPAGSNKKIKREELLNLIA